MLKVLIVDDFPVDRETLLEMISNNPVLNNLDIIGECEDGVQTLEFIKTNEPDIIISDIEMPNMNGFELAKNIRKNYPHIKIIFCSLYREFEYAKKALYVGSYGYLLKPFDQDELQECIQKAIDTISSEQEYNREHEYFIYQLKENKPFLIENLIHGLIYGTIQKSDDIQNRMDFLGLQFKQSIYILSLIEIDDFQNVIKGLNIEQSQIFSRKVFQRIGGILMNIHDILLVRLDDSRFLMVHFYSLDYSMEADMHKVHSCCQLISKAFDNSDISLSIAVSSSTGDIYELKHLYEQCLYILRYKYSLGKGKVLYSSDIPSSQAHSDLDYNSIEKEIRYLLNSGTIPEIDNYICELFNQAGDNVDNSELKGICSYIMICLQNMVRANKEVFSSMFTDGMWTEWDTLLRLETPNDAKLWIMEVLHQTNRRIRNRENHKNSMIVDKIKKYAERHYNKHISLVSLSEELYYSPNYLNYIFKQETGETIFDYAIRFKVEKAKEMLADSKNKLYEIAETLGYSHTAYFSNLFKKYTGVTPKDYRRGYVT